MHPDGLGSGDGALLVIIPCIALFDSGRGDCSWVVFVDSDIRTAVLLTRRRAAIGAYSGQVKGETVVWIVPFQD